MSKQKFTLYINLYLKLLLAPVLVLLFQLPLNAQKGNHYMDVGGGGGGTSYVGDLNMTAVPNRVLGHAMGTFRYAYSELFALRANFLFGLADIRKTSDSYYLPQLTGAQNIEGGVFWHLGVDLSSEIHLKKYQVGHFTHTRVNRTNWTPYITVGVGFLYALFSGASYFPIGGGVKFAIGGRWTLAPECRFLKLFSDNFDGYSNWPLSDSGGVFHNRDWVSMLSFTVTYRLYINVPRCPAYIEE